MTGNQRKRALHEAEGLVLAAEEEGRDLTSEEEKRYDELMGQLDDAPVRKAPVQQLRHNEDGTRRTDARKSRTRGIVGGGREERSYERVFGPADDDGGFESFDDFLRSVCTGNDHRLGEWQRRSMQEGLDSSGGFLVPAQYAREVFNEALEDEVIRPLARMYSMTSDRLAIPALGIGDHSSDRHDGLISYWKSEGSQLTEKQPAFRQVTLNAQKLTCYGIASNEVLADGIGFAEAIGRAFIDELSWKMDEAFIRGTGAGQPLGILNADCKIATAAEDGQTADTVVSQNIFKMYANMHPAGAKRGIWVVHPSVMVELYNSYIAVGTGGSSVFLPGGTIAAQPYNTIMGRPVHISEKCSILGDEGDIMFIDPQAYAIGMRAEVQIAKSEHLKFDYDQTAIRGVVRVDGQPLWDEALTLRDGSTTVGPFVTLAART